MTKRRANNEGTIYEDKEKGGYRVQLTAPDGSRISKRFKDPEEAVTWKNNKLSEFSKKLYVAPQKVTLRQWREDWLEIYKKPNTKPRTWEEYEGYCERYLKDIDNIEIQKLVGFHITKTYNAMRKKKISEATILKLHNILNDMFNQARIDKIIINNPMDDVKRPSPKKKEMVKLDEDEILKLLKALEGTRIYAGVFLMANTGMRVGEVLGLRWKDIDFDEGIISISQNLQRSKTKGLAKELPKTESSFRSIYVTDEVLVVLSAEYQRQQADVDLKKSSTVVCNRLAKPLEPRRFAREFDRVRNEIGMNNVTRHALRHALASLLIDNDVPIPEVSALLGHSDQAFTYRTYVHSRKDATKKAAAAISEIFKPKTDTANVQEKQKETCE